MHLQTSQEKQSGKDRQRVLIVAPVSPWPSNGGGELRTALFAEALSQVATIRVLSLYAVDSLQPPANIQEVVIRPGIPPQLWGMRSADRPLAPLLPMHLVKRIERHLTEFRPDVVIFEQTITTGLLDQLDVSGAKIVFNSHNFDTGLASQVDQASEWWSPSKSPSYALAQETLAAQRSDLLICCSETDATSFQAKTGVNAKVVPNPLPDGRAFDIPIERTRYTNPDILYVGAMGYPPNRLAVETLVETFDPKRAEGMTIHVVGRNADTLKPLIHDAPNVSITANAPEILPFLRDVGFTVMPITKGSGTRLKVLEAMAAGVVVIATTKAVEGLGLEPDTHYVQAETPDALLQKYHEMLADPDKSLALATTARQFVKEHYSQDQFQSKVQDLFRHLATNRPA